MFNRIAKKKDSKSSNSISYGGGGGGKGGIVISQTNNSSSSNTYLESQQEDCENSESSEQEEQEQKEQQEQTLEEEVEIEKIQVKTITTITTNTDSNERKLMSLDELFQNTNMTALRLSFWIEEFERMVKCGEGESQFFEITKDNYAKSAQYCDALTNKYGNLLVIKEEDKYFYKMATDKIFFSKLTSNQYKIDFTHIPFR